MNDLAHVPSGGWDGIQPSDSAGGGRLLLRSCFCIKVISPNKRHGDGSRGSYLLIIANFTNKRLGKK